MLYMAGGFLRMYKKKSTYKPKKRYYKKSVKPSKNLVKVVQKIIHKNVETKQGYHERATASYNSGINAVGDATRVLPNIGRGTSDNERIGDQITTRSLSIKGAIVYNPSTGQYGTFGNARIAVRLMVVQPRQYSNLDDVQNNAPTWTASLLKKGGSTSAFNGNLGDLWAPINTDQVIKYYDRIIYMDAPYQATAVGSTLMGKSTKLFSINMKLKNKILKYDSSVSGGVQPTNYAPVVLLGYAHMDGSAPDTLTTAVQLTYDTIMNYEDA